MVDSMVVISGHVVEEVELSLADLSTACQVDAEWLMLLVGEGILEPLERRKTWHFAGHSVRRIRTVQRLQQDLGVNLAGAALALDLLVEVNQLRARLSVFEPDEEG